jgi:hypothetical protein
MLFSFPALPLAVECVQVITVVRWTTLQMPNACCLDAQINPNAPKCPGIPASSMQQMYMGDPIFVGTGQGKLRALGQYNYYCIGTPYWHIC